LDARLYEREPLLVWLVERRGIEDEVRDVLRPR
jgi:hypothetical protein